MAAAQRRCSAPRSDMTRTFGADIGDKSDAVLAAVRALDADIDLLVGDLALGLFLEADRELHAALGATTERTALRLESRAVWIEVGGRSQAEVHRRAPSAPSRDLSTLLAEQPRLAERLRLGHARDAAVRRAEELITPLANPHMTPTRAECAVIERWRPLVEQTAYKITARASTVLDLMRPQLFKLLDSPDGQTREFARSYWSLLLVLAHGTLIGAGDGAAPWLGPMANDFVWRFWSPSFPLIRERSLYLALIAGRAAAAFGDQVIDAYCKRLHAAEHPFVAFDAIFGLTAIALRAAPFADDVQRELSAPLALTRHAEHVAPIIRTALEVLEAPERAADRARGIMGWDSETESLATRAALVADPASYGADRRHLGLLCLPIGLAASPKDFLPRGAQAGRLPRLWLSSGQIEALLRATWRPGPIA
jgi:hypothetical protein